MRNRFIFPLLALAVLFSLNRPISAKANSYTIKGDINADEAVTIEDAILLQKWLSGDSETILENWQAADLNQDGKLDGVDLCQIKIYLLTQRETVHFSSPVCKAAAFASVSDKTLLYSDRIHERIAPASLTKLLTASVALHYLPPETVITVGTEQSLVKPRSSLCLIKQGHRLKLSDLLMGMLMASGNDAAYTVAAATARTVKPETVMTDEQSVSFFTDLMNDYAVSIGMQESHFTTPDGWDDDSQYTTVSDLLILAEHALSIPTLKEITGKHQKKVYFVSGENVMWTNTNALLDPNSKYYCADAVGVKTGTTSGAGNCLIAAFERNKKTYLSVAVGCATGTDRYELTLKMLSSIGGT